MLNYTYSPPFCKNCAHSGHDVSSCSLEGTHTCICVKKQAFDEHAQKLSWVEMQVLWPIVKSP